MELFKKFPKIQYNNNEMLNNITRVITIEQKLRYYDIYFPYTIKDGERADTVAYDYYGDSSFSWLIYLTNKIYDPYYQWPLTYKQFIDYLNKKYGSFTTTQTTIKHYIYTGVDGDNIYDIAAKEYDMSVVTFNALSIEERAGWTAEYVYEWEYKINEAKREIKLLSNTYLPQIEKELTTMFDGV